jgi:tetratricopeptide (TPR) repeat protein
LSKRKRKRRRSPPSAQGSQRHQPSVALRRTLDRAERMIDGGRAQEAIALLEPLLPSYPRVADLHYYLGYARVMAGDIWGALPGYERAVKLSRDPGYWLPLASLYLRLELNAYALHAFRQVQAQQIDVPGIDDVREPIAVLESRIADIAHGLGLPVAQVKQGLREFEDGQRALHQNDFPACIAANRRAIRLLADWPPPRNNLSLALFFDGQPEKAIRTARQVISQAPHNLQALSNTIRFLAWTGQEADARALWPQLKEVVPQNDSGRMKMAEAAAVLGEDESVYRLLSSVEESSATREAASGLTQRTQLFLAVAEANLGKRSARRRLRALRSGVPWAGDLLVALVAGRPGPGWAEHFPYFHSTELMPAPRIDEFVRLVGRRDELPSKKFRSQVARFVARFPQIVLMAEKMIWEDEQPEGGVAILTTVATPAAYAALRRFGLSQAGDDETRMQALLSLSKAGEIARDETLRLWSGGEWREVQLRGHEISDERETEYTAEVAELLNEGVSAFQQGDDDQAEQLLRRAVELDPRAKEAYNNLATIYARRGEHERAREMYQAAVEIDPLYAFPRCNLASYLLDEDDTEGALDMLRPLADAHHFLPQEMAFYSYTQARILLRQEEYEKAHNALKLALEMWPGYGPAEDLLERLEGFSFLTRGFESFFEQQRKRDQANRARLQAKLSTPEPSLSEALALYTKEALTGMARVVVRWGGWSALRKAELLERIVGELRDPENLERVIDGLTDEEHAALRQVLAHGGHMAWQEFDAVYGNDLEESRYWQYHVPETTMGRLRLRGLLVESTVDGELLVAVPSELRQALEEALS